MTATVLASSASFVADQTNVAFNSGAGTNRCLYVWTYAQGLVVNSATYAGVAMTLVGTFGVAKLWRLMAPASGSNNLRFVTSTSGGTMYDAVALSDVDQTTPNGTVVSSSSTSAAGTTPSITVPTNGLALGFLRLGYRSSGTPAIAGGSTLRGALHEGGSGHGIAGGSRTTTGTIAWSHESTDWMAIGIPVNATVVPGALSGGVTLDDVTVNGSLTVTNSDMSGGITLDSVAVAGSLSMTQGEVIALALRNWSGSLQTSTTIPVVSICDLTTGAQVLVLEDQVTDATTGDLTLTSALLSPGTTYMVTGWNADGSARFAVPLTASEA